MVKRWRAGSFRGTVISVAVSLVVGVAAVRWAPFDIASGELGFETDRVLTTELGEHRDITLPGGRQVVMNTQTSITTHEAAHEMQLALQSGEILVDAAARADSKPVRVIAGTVAVQANQGKFSFRRAAEGEYVVRVFSGDVLLRPAPSLMAVNLKGGNSASLSPGKLVVDGFTPERARRLLSWTAGKLIFDGERLEDIASEFNRYNREKILIATESIAQLRVGGSFSATNPEGFAQKLETIFNVRAVTVRSGGRGASVIILKPRNVPGPTERAKSASVRGPRGV
jgi:transmembrane sensor